MLDAPKVRKVGVTPAPNERSEVDTPEAAAAFAAVRHNVMVDMRRA